MNKLQLLIALSITVLSFAACDKGSENELPSNTTEDACYKGTMVVDQNDGTFYTQENVEVDFEIKDGKLNFGMYKVKFASGMPLKLNMFVSGADFIKTDNSYTISGNGLIPYAMGGPFEKFTITNLVGTITPNTMTLDFICGEYPVTYSGTK